MFILQTVALLERVISSSPKHRKTQKQNKHVHKSNIHALCGIRTNDPDFRASETVHASERSAAVTGWLF
jgi:hypothetical protein